MTAAARIRDAAIRRFATQGFTASVRQIAADAEVSPGLVIHHFGTKDRLREVCDAHVSDQIRVAKTEVLTAADPGMFLSALAAVTDYAPLAGYVVRSLVAGGDLAARFIEHMVDDVRTYLQEAEAAGTVRPSRDPEARARYLALQGLGLLLMQINLSGGVEKATDLAAVLTAVTAWTTLPALEIFTEGLLTDNTLLSGYLAHVGGNTPARTPSSDQEEQR